MEENKMTDKATIDSLKEMAIKFSKDSYACRVLANAINMIQDLQSENERLTEEKKNLSVKVWNYEQPARNPLYSSESMVNCNLVTCYNENADLKAKNAELQKKIDELKKSQVKHIHIDDQFKKECEYELQQAVKDTAKEILEELDLFFKGTTFRQGYEFKKINEKLKEIAKRKGVEVK